MPALNNTKRYIFSDQSGEQTMSNKTTKRTLATAVGATLAGSLALATGTQAAENPFGLQELNSGYMQIAMEEGKCGGTKTEAEGKCGEQTKAKEGKCGDEKAKEGTCGDNKEEAAKPPMEGKCGEGKCGSDM
jgi:uncharacterized low-complexity protein